VIMTGLGFEPRTYGLKVTAEDPVVSVAETVSALMNDE